MTNYVVILSEEERKAINGYPFGDDEAAWVAAQAKLATAIPEDEAVKRIALALNDGPWEGRERYARATLAALKGSS